jgi:methionyl aminopeptidase
MLGGGNQRTVAITEDGPLVLTRRKSELRPQAGPEASESTQARLP